MRSTTVIVLALVLSTGSARAQDVCAGATPSRAMAKGGVGPSVSVPSGAREAIASGQLGVARGVNLYPGSGTGPMPDITDWKPRGKLPMGGELIIQGRNLVPGQLVAMLSGSLLTPTTQSTSEIRFRVTDPSPASALVVYIKNGQPRTLESAYVVYDPTATITRVVPAAFSVGDVVTVCGASLFDASFADVYSPGPVTGVPQMSQVIKQTGSFVRLGDGYWLEALNPAVSPTGDRITFQAGGVDTTARACNGFASCSTLAGITDFAAGFPKRPSSVSGAIKVRLTGVNRSVSGPSVTWQLAAPRITRAYGKLFGDHDPFVLLPTGSTQNFLAQAYVDGMYLDDASWRIGTMTVSGGASGGANSGMPTNGSFAILSVPLNASSGTVCATSNNKTGCSPAPLQIFGGPVITRMPAMPLALRTSYTIDGLNLLPPSNITGLKYQWKAGMGVLDSTATNLTCNMVLQVLEHTASRIVFRIGDPAKTAPLPASCASNQLFQQNAMWTMNINATLAGQSGSQTLLKQVPFYLKP